MIDRLPMVRMWFWAGATAAIIASCGDDGEGSDATACTPTECAAACVAAGRDGGACVAGACVCTGEPDAGADGDDGDDGDNDGPPDETAPTEDVTLPDDGSTADEAADVLDCPDGSVYCPPDDPSRWGEDWAGSHPGGCVDLDVGVIHVERSAPGGEAGTKSGERRDVPLHPVARAALEQLLRRRRPSALLWQTRTGKPYQTAWRAFHGAAKRAKVSDVRLHDLRHTAASRLAMTGASLSDIAAILGHRDLRTTRRYVHLLRSHLRDRVMAIPAVPDDRPETGNGPKIRKT